MWVSDMLGSQRGHAEEWQVCLAHLLRDATYAVQCGDTAFSAPFKLLLLRAIAIGRRRDTLKDATLKQYQYDLERRLDRLIAAHPVGEPGRKLRKRMLANRPYLFVFITNRDVPYTNNVSERHLRPSVIFRKVTNGFRCDWGAETYAAFRSVVSTAKANRASVLASRPVRAVREITLGHLTEVGWTITLRVWPVGKAVGNVKNDGPELLEPTTMAEPTLTTKSCACGTGCLRRRFALAGQSGGTDAVFLLVVVGLLAACAGPKLPAPNSADVRYDGRDRAVQVMVSNLQPPTAAALVANDGDTLSRLGHLRS